MVDVYSIDMDWDEFIKVQPTDFLMRMRSKVSNELIRRRYDALKDIKETDEKIEEEIERDAQV